MSSHSRLPGATSDTTSMSARSSVSLSRSWISRPPSTRRRSRSPGLDLRRSRSSSTRVVGLDESVSRAPSSYPGANSTSTFVSMMRAATSAVTDRFTAITAPNADIGSAASARTYASSSVAPTATPHGPACLTMAHAGSWNAATMARAACRSATLLNDSGLPLIWSMRESTCRRAPVSR